MPPLAGAAVKVTLVPVHILVVDVEMLTEAAGVPNTVIVASAVNVDGLQLLFVKVQRTI